MSNPVVSGHAIAVRKLEWVSTGVERLDALIRGYPKGRSTLLMGGAGTGKTILTMHFIKAACARGEHTVQILTEEVKDDIFAQADSFGWDFARYEADGLLTVVEVLPERAMGAKLPEDFQHFLERIRPAKGSHIILDNLSVFGRNHDPARFRDQMDTMVYKLKQHESTGLFVYDEDVQEEYKNAITHATFGAVRLFRRSNPFTDQRERAMEVLKMRSTRVPSSFIFYDIGDKGIEIVGDAASGH